ncbi:uncharacterized protein Tco025E_08863 [Trypanosoma conorhini]|uniref:Nodulin-like domain-containing protein n=1 Tax=Trypanosoma conorhini TaxID=83891 RepID=A0A3R7K1L4_9TRYP|nr:uncharacterized protein Tco025E_08863 [Trypanosoma conorhini]RNF00204.1 hypothetical protein Tco025E_08863 [Trypanosoma conorhini]
MLLPVRWLGGMDGDAEEEPGRANAAEEESLPVRDNKAGPDPADTELLDIPKNWPDNGPDEAANVSDVDSESPQDPRYGGSVWDNLKRADIWLIFIAFICQSAMGVIVVYNASTISVALTGHKRSQQTSALYTAFLGVSSSIGRMAMGMFEAFVQHQPADNRRFLVTLALPLSPFLAAVAGVLLLTIPGEAILLPYIIVYFEEDVFAAVAAVMFPSLFASNHGVYYNVGFLTSVFSVVGFNRFLFGYVVDAKHASFGLDPKEGCTVAECVRLPIIVSKCVEALGAALSFLVHIRYSRFVRRRRYEAEEMD